MSWKDPNAWKKYYENNKEHIKAEAKKRYKKNAAAKRAYSKNRYKENPDLVKFEVRRSFLKRKYGVSTEQFNTMLAATKGRCPCCRKKVIKQAHWTIDHCHRRNKVRGLICGKCNCALGFVKDSVKTLRRMVLYLERT